MKEEKVIMRRRLWVVFALCLALVAIGGGAVGAAMKADIFVQLCGTGKAEQVRAALAGGANANEPSAYNGLTPLMAAVSHDSEVVSVLLAAGANVNARTEGSGLTVLMRAGSKPEVINALVKAGADVNGRDFNGYTALMYAVMAKDGQKINALIKAGADVNAKNNQGETALMLTERIEVIDILVTAGAQGEARRQKRDASGGSPAVVNNLNQYESSNFVTYILVALLIALIPGIITGMIAQSKGYSFFLWFFCGYIVFIIALPLAIIIKPTKKVADNKALNSGTSKKCSYCFEVIDRQASICRFCHKEQPVA